MKSMNYWNAGFTAEEVLSKYGVDVSEDFKYFESKIGCRSFTVAELVYEKIGAKFPPSKNIDPAYLEWRGDIGSGKKIREFVKNNKN